MSENTISWEIAFQAEQIRSIANDLAGQHIGTGPNLAELPGATAFFACAGVGQSSPTRTLNSVDEGGFLLLQGGAVFSEYSGTPHITLDGSTGYLDGGDNAMSDISGTETYIDASIRGFTTGGWFFLTRALQTEGLITKWGLPSNRSFYMLKNVVDDLQFIITDNGTSTASMSHTVQLPLNEWVFLAARFIPGVSLSVALRNIIQTSATTKTSIYQSSAELFIGAVDTTPKNYLQGSVSRVFITSTALSDITLKAIYETTKHLYE